MSESANSGSTGIYVLECECGWVGEGDEVTLVELAQAHGLEVHKFAPAADQVIAAARPRL